jgi:hypothetical protein
MLWGPKFIYIKENTFLRHKNKPVISLDTNNRCVLVSLNEQNTKCLNVKAVGIYTNHCILEGYFSVLWEHETSYRNQKKYGIYSNHCVFKVIVQRCENLKPPTGIRKILVYIVTTVFLKVIVHRCENRNQKNFGIVVNIGARVKFFEFCVWFISFVKQWWNIPDVELRYKGQLISVRLTHSVERPRLWELQVST